MSTPIVMLVGKGKSGKDTAGAAIAKAFGGVCIALADPIKRALRDRRMFVLSEEQLWGSKKEELISMGGPSTCGPWAADCAFALSDALMGWKTPSELHKFPFAQWLQAIPHRETTPRHLMQTFGTECIRSVEPDFWIDYGLWLAGQLLTKSFDYEASTGLRSSLRYSNVVCITDGRFRNEVLPVRRHGGLALEVWRPGTEVQAGFSPAAKAHSSETESGTIPRWWFDGRLENDGTLEEFQAAAVSLARAVL